MSLTRRAHALRSTKEMNQTLSPEFLNDCLEAYIRTFTVKGKRPSEDLS